MQKTFGFGSTTGEAFYQGAHHASPGPQGPCPCCGTKDEFFLDLQSGRWECMDCDTAFDINYVVAA